MAKIKRVLVTGGAGFIGSHIVDALLKRKIKVLVIDDLSTGQKQNLNSLVQFEKMSILDKKIEGVLKKFKPEVVFHCAAQIDVRRSVDDPMTDAKKNILGLLNLLKVASAIKVQKIIFSSSGGAMYSDKVCPPYSEKQPAEPISPYGIAKRTGEMYLEFFQQVYHLPYVALRYANVYGPRQNSRGEAGVMAIFISRMLKGEKVKINGNGRQTRDFVYVDDVVRANLLAMQKKVTGIFHIGTGIENDIKTVFQKINFLTKAGLKEEYASASAGEVMRSALKSQKAKKYLTWQAKINLDQGLKKTVQWFKKNS